MKKLLLLPLVSAALLSNSCTKPQGDAERDAEVERKVQERVAAERQADDQQKLAQKQADLDAREAALTAKENATATPAANARRTVTSTEETATAEATPRHARTATETAAPRSYGMFYQKLEPYGDWRETDDYGYVFQPREAEQSRHWRPYTDGRWVYTDAGWTWVSEEPFGWATYHYGRWARLQNVGWVWVPGQEWAPAWVSWRKSDDYVGWAPLPPEAHFDRHAGIHNWSDNYYDIGPTQYTFVETQNLGARDVRTSVVPTEQNVTIINKTTNVTNITYNNTTVVNGGPSYEEFSGRSQQPIERLRLERTSDANVTSERPILRGEVIAFPAPAVQPNAQLPDRPRTVRETIAAAVVDRGWAAITDQTAASQARAKMKSEATPPPSLPAKPVMNKSAESAAAPAASTTATAAPTAATTAPKAATTPTPTATPSAHPVTTPQPTATPMSTPAATATPTLTTTPISKHKPAATSTPMEMTTATPMATATATATPFPTPPARKKEHGALVSPAAPAPAAASPSATAAPESGSVAPEPATPNSSLNVPRGGGRKAAEALRQAQAREAADAQRQGEQNERGRRQAEREGQAPIAAQPQASVAVPAASASATPAAESAPATPPPAITTPTAQEPVAKPHGQGHGNKAGHPGAGAESPVAAEPGTSATATEAVPAGQPNGKKEKKHRPGQPAEEAPNAAESPAVVPQ